MWKMRTLVRVEVPSVHLPEGHAVTEGHAVAEGHAVYTVVTSCGGERHETLK
jgi:hypothetical protein